MSLGGAYNATNKTEPIVTAQKSEQTPMHITKLLVPFADIPTSIRVIK